MASPARFRVLSPKSEAGRLLVPELCRYRAFPSAAPTRQDKPAPRAAPTFRWPWGGLGEDAVNRALAYLEGGGNLGPGAAGGGQLDHLRRLRGRAAAVPCTCPRPWRGRSPRAGARA